MCFKYISEKYFLVYKYTNSTLEYTSFHHYVYGLTGCFEEACGWMSGQYRTCWPSTADQTQTGGLVPVVLQHGGKLRLNQKEPVQFSQSIYLLPKETTLADLYVFVYNLQPSGRNITWIMHDWNILTDVKSIIYISQGFWKS